jgi:diguanylate cyclase (GGDEF)-like protein
MDVNRNLAGFVLMMRDVTKEKETEATIRHLAFHDPLTNLPNRVLLQERLGQALTHTARYGNTGAFMMLDLDRFKDINDTLGHSVGDMLLQEVSSRLMGVLRKSDTVARMGGDEFVVLVPTLNSQESVAAIVAKILKSLRKPYLLEGERHEVTTSIGVACFPEDGADAETLLKNADIALYRAKEMGRNRCQFFGKEW